MAIIDEADRRPLWQRLAWMAVIWLASVVALGCIAAIIRMVVGPS